jgi:hypothetical protein
MFSKQQVAKQVQQRLNRLRLDVRIHVFPEEIRKERTWWYVPVHPSSEPVRRSEYYDALANVEQQLLDKDKINISFIPADPAEVK